MAELTLFATYPTTQINAKANRNEESISTRKCRLGQLRFTRVNELDERVCSQCGKPLQVGGMALIQDREGGAIWCKTDCAEKCQSIGDRLGLGSNATQLDLPLCLTTHSPRGVAGIADRQANRY